MNISIFAENSFAHQSGRIQVQRNGVELELPECENWSWKVLGWPIRPARTNIKTRCPFHHRGMECKQRKSRDTWSNRQVWSRSTKLSKVKANRIWIRSSSNNTRDDSTHGHHQMLNIKIRLIIFFQLKMEKLYTVSKNKTWSWLWLRSWTHCVKIQTYIQKYNIYYINHENFEVL